MVKEISLSPTKLIEQMQETSCSRKRSFIQLHGGQELVDIQSISLALGGYITTIHGPLHLSGHPVGLED